MAATRIARDFSGGCGLGELQDTLRIRDLELRFQGGLNRPPEGTDQVIYIFKDRDFVSREDAILERTNPRRMIEIGVLFGGSTIYWHERHKIGKAVRFRQRCHYTGA